MTIQQTTPDKAKEILDQDPEAIYVDVRSIPEFTAGHPIRAVNIPLLHKNPGSGMMEPNPDFLAVAEAVLPREKKLLVGCMMGGRSQKACEILEQNGFKILFNVYGGFGGARDPGTGRVFQAGWRDLGLPVSMDNGDGVGYGSLKGKAGI